jgi:hypothetical protein
MTPVTPTWHNVALSIAVRQRVEVPDPSDRREVADRARSFWAGEHSMTNPGRRHGRPSTSGEGKMSLISQIIPDYP